MSRHEIYNTNVAAERILIAPAELKRHLPNTEEGEDTVWQARQTIKNILSGKDHRLLVVTGPCSIHDVGAAREYAERLLGLREELADSLYGVTMEESGISKMISVKLTQKEV
jgi:3-deoxy-7-phosphoheptulonate synthase